MHILVDECDPSQPQTIDTRMCSWGAPSLSGHAGTAIPAVMDSYQVDAPVYAAVGRGCYNSDAVALVHEEYRKSNPQPKPAGLSDC